jgi:hypothetical protein
MTKGAVEQEDAEGTEGGKCGMRSSEWRQLASAECGIRNSELTADNAECGTRNDERAWARGAKNIASAKKLGRRLGGELA